MSRYNVWVLFSLVALNSCGIESIEERQRRERLEFIEDSMSKRAALEAQHEAEELEKERRARVLQEQEAALAAEERRTRFLDNRLTSGSRPFSECWRSGLSGECGVEVTAAATHEVLVTVKRGEEDGPVVGHVYVAAGGTGKIQFASGTYQVFFSQGKGWDPNASNPIRNCDEPAWFVDFYGVTKDEPDFYPEGQVYTYELQPVQQGNFRAEGSDPSEAF